MNKIIEIAQKEIGYSETPKDSNMTKYGQWFGLDGMKWCAIFCSWVYSKAGYQLEPIGFDKGFAGCQTAVQYFKKTNQVTQFPVPGDLVFYDWNHDRRYDHVGIYVETLNNVIKAIEGNTSVGNNSNGGTVMARLRSKNITMIFVHPHVLDKDVTKSGEAYFNAVTIPSTIKRIEQNANDTKA